MRRFDMTQLVCGRAYGKRFKTIGDNMYVCSGWWGRPCSRTCKHPIDCGPRQSALWMASTPLQRATWGAFASWAAGELSRWRRPTTPLTKIVPTCDRPRYMDTVSEMYRNLPSAARANANPSRAWKKNIEMRCGKLTSYISGIKGNVSDVGGSSYMDASICGWKNLHQNTALFDDATCVY